MSKKVMTTCPRNKVVGIAGSIGVGKSTFGENFLKEGDKVWGKDSIIFEQEKVIQSLLSRFLKDQKTWAPHFQTLMGMAAAGRQKRAHDLRTFEKPNALILVERPLFENRIFAEANMLLDNLTKDYFEGWYTDLLNAHHTSHPDLIVYLHTSERVRAYRQCERNRTDEDLYEDEYMMTLSDCYWKFVLEHAQQKRLLVLNWNEYGNMKKVTQLVAKVLNGELQLPTVTVSELCSSGDSGDEEAVPQQMVVSIAKQPLKHLSTSTARKRRLAQDLVMEALARFEDIEIRT